jgi:hypothetical protein
MIVEDFLPVYDVSDPSQRLLMPTSRRHGTHSWTWT